MGWSQKIPLYVAPLFFTLMISHDAGFAKGQKVPTEIFFAGSTRNKNIQCFWFVLNEAFEL